MKLTKELLANAFALTGAILWIACTMIAILLPGLYRAGAELFALGNVGHQSLSFYNVVLGGVLFAIVSWVVGYVFGWSLELLSKRK